MYVMFWKVYTTSNIFNASLTALLLLVIGRLIKYVLVRYNINFIKFEDVLCFLQKLDQKIIALFTSAKNSIKDYLNTYVFITKLKNLLSAIELDFPLLQFVYSKFSNVFEIIISWYNNNRKNIWMYVRIYLYISVLLFYISLILTIIMLFHQNFLLDAIGDFSVWTYRFWTFFIRRVRFLIGYTYMVPLNTFFYFHELLRRMKFSAVFIYEIIFRSC
jgi:hypothetical protein